MENIDLRKLLGWIFAATSLLYLLIALPRNRYLVFHPSEMFLSLRHALYVPFFVLIIIVCGAAWWTIWKGMSSARGWALAASIVQILIFLRSILVFHPYGWSHHIGALCIGIVGLVVFSPWYERREFRKNVVG